MKQAITAYIYNLRHYGFKAANIGFKAQVRKAYLK